MDGEQATVCQLFDPLGLMRTNASTVKDSGRSDASFGISSNEAPVKEEAPAKRPRKAAAPKAEAAEEPKNEE